MKQKRFLLHLVTAIVFMAVIIINPVITNAADSQNANRMNVVFVMDESGSMKDTDAEKLRYDAMDLFMGLATDNGNYMGAVSFDTNILLQENITQINGIDSKDQLSQKVRSSSSNGDTDIGKAIETATRMLQEQGNPDLPSAVILLSDGNTDLKSDTAYQESIASKNNAIETARANGYKIYSVCLNANGEADPTELKEISEATGAISMEVKNAQDLKEVFNQFYDIIYSTQTVVLGDMVIPENGEVEIPFSIPRIGVEEANIIISTLNPDTSYSLTQPGNITYTTEEMNAIKTSIDTFSILKIKNPVEGEWKLVVKGIPGDNVKIEMVYNSDLTVGLEVNDGSEYYAGDDILIRARLMDWGTAVEDETIYQDYPMHIVFTNFATGASEDYVMEAESSSAVYRFHVPEDAVYDIYVYCEINNMKVVSEIYHLNVSNASPKYKNYIIKITKILSPFSGEEHRVDLGEVITDKEDETLTYKITRSDFAETSVFIDGKNLNIRLKEVGKGGHLYIEAMDSQNATAEVRIDIKIISLFFILLVSFVVITLTAAVIIIVIHKVKYGKFIRGRVMILPYTEDGTLGNNTYDGCKGKMYLRNYLNIRENIGMDMKNTYFVAGEKENYIYLISKNGYYTEADPNKKSKKIRLNSEMEVNVSNDIDFMKGIRVTYISDNH